MNVLWETMIAEMRAERVELDVRRHFTPENQPIELVRALLADWTSEPEPQDYEAAVAATAASLRLASSNELFDVG